MPRPTPKTRIRRYAALFRGGAWCLALLLVGCASGSTSYVNDNFDFGYIEKVAVMPFENHTEEKFAQERLRDIAVTEMLSRRLFDVVEKGDLDRFLREEIVAREQKFSLDLATSKRMAERLSAQAYLAGSVDDFKEESNGNYRYAVVAVTLRLVDGESGKIIWQASGHDNGYSSVDRLFGFASDDENQIIFRLVRKLLKTLPG